MRGDLWEVQFENITAPWLGKKHKDEKVWTEARVCYGDSI